MLGAQNLDWEDIKSFAVAAKVGSVRGAAREMSVHHSTVSRRIDNLEHALGTRLFDRQPEGFILTAAGEELAVVVQDCGLRLGDAERLISGQDRDLSGVVTVTMAGPLAVHVFGPKMAEFAQAYPKIEIRMLSTTSVLDISRREADVAIRTDNNPPQSLVGKRFFPYYQTIYGSQDYLDGHDFQNNPEAARWISWQDKKEVLPSWVYETEFGRVPVWGYFPDPALQQSAARGGLGLVMLPCFIGDADPFLVRASSRRPHKARDIWLLTHSDLRRTARIKAFMTFAEKVLRDAKPLLTGSAHS